MAEDNNFDNNNQNNNQNQNDNQNGNQNDNGEGNNPKTYTQEEVDAMLKSERDEKTKFQRMAEQRAKKLEEAGKSDNKNNSNDKKFGLLEKTYLNANGIKTEAEIDYIQKTAERTGLPIEDLVSDEFVQGKLKQIRDAQANAEASPRNNNRGGNAPQSTVEYWINKGELPPKSEVKLRRDVVNEKLKRSQATNKFQGASEIIIK